MPNTNEPIEWGEPGPRLGCASPAIASLGDGSLAVVDRIQLSWDAYELMQSVQEAGQVTGSPAASPDEMLAGLEDEMLAGWSGYVRSQDGGGLPALSRVDGALPVAWSMPPIWSPLRPATSLLNHLRYLYAVAEVDGMDPAWLGQELEQVMEHMEQGRAEYAGQDTTAQAMDAYLEAVFEMFLCLREDDPVHLGRGLGMAERADVALQEAMHCPEGVGVSFQIRSRVRF